LEGGRTAGIIFCSNPLHLNAIAAGVALPALLQLIHAFGRGTKIGKPQMLPGYSKSAIGYAHGRWTLTREFLMFEWVAWLRC
jgi:hypothetical protein